MDDYDDLMNPDASNVEDYQLYLRNMLDNKNIVVQNQNQKIAQLKQLVAQDLERIEKLDGDIPAEEGKITQLIAQYSNLQNRFQLLQSELNCHIHNEDQYKNAIENTDKQMQEINANQMAMQYQINQSKIQQNHLNQSIKSLANSYQILSDDYPNTYPNPAPVFTQNQIDQMKMNYFVKRQEDLDNQNRKLEKKRQILEKDAEIEEYKNKNLKTQLEIYNLLRRKYELVKTKNQLQKIEEMSSDIATAQSELNEKNTILNDELQQNSAYKHEFNKRKSKLSYPKKKIHQLKSLIHKVNEQIQQENSLIECIRQQYLSSMITSAQLSTRLNQANLKISELRNEKSLMKKELEMAQIQASILQNKMDVGNNPRYDSMDDIYNVMNQIQGSYNNINQQIQEMKNNVRKLETRTPEYRYSNDSERQSRQVSFNQKQTMKGSKHQNDENKNDPYFFKPKRRYEPY